MLTNMDLKEKQYEVLNLWPVPIFLSHIPVKDSYLNIIKKIKLERASNQRFDISEDKTVLNKIKDLKTEIEKQIELFVRDHLKINKKIEFYITDSWLNKFEKGEGSTHHSHVNSMLSGCYYFKRSSEMGGIQFQKGYQTNHNIFYPNIWMEYDEATHATGMAFNIKPKEGGLILFPSKVEHTVLDNNSSDTRYSIAFNVHVKGQFVVKDFTGKQNYILNV